MKYRNLQPELMDQPGLEEKEHIQALRGLARINRISASARLLWRPIRRLARQTGVSHFRVLDIASGGGDVAIDLWKRAAADNVSLEIVGCDVSATAVAHAQQAAKGVSPAIRFEQRDIFADTPSEPFDIVTCSLFLHHLPKEKAVELLRLMSKLATQLVLVNDLARGYVAYVAAVIGCQSLTRSRIVHTDGPRSVAGAFTVAEMRNLIEQVPLTGATISRRWPYRFLLEWKARHDV